MSTRDRVHSGSCPIGIVSIRDGVQSVLCQLGICPDTLHTKSDCSIKLLTLDQLSIQSLRIQKLWIRAGHGAYPERVRGGFGGDIQLFFLDPEWIRILNF